MGKKKEAKNTLNYSKGSGLNVRLRGKKLSGGKISLYLDYYQGFHKDIETNKIKVNRKIEYLKIYLKETPQTPDERTSNNTCLILAQNIRDKREKEIQHNAEGFVSPDKKKVNFFDYCDTYEATYKKKDIRMIEGAIREFKKYTNETFLKPNQIDSKLIKGFKDYLINKFNGETPHSYFARFKKILTAATDEGYFLKNPSDKITCSTDKNRIPKEILLVDDIIKLSETPIHNPEIKRGFLFCLNTGLRYVDIKDLKFEHIQNNQIRKKQLKTGSDVIIDLNINALNLLGEIGEPGSYVFNLPSLTGCLKSLKVWAKNAGINRNITWHSARHSFATILLMNKTDIKTVSSLLGHSKLEHTQKYTHVIDSLKKEAVNSLPEMNF